MQEKEKQQEKTKGNTSPEGGQPQDNSNQTENANIGDDHSFWEDAFEKQYEPDTQNEEKSQDAEVEPETQEETQGESDINFDEKEEFDQNRAEKRAKFKSMRENAEKNIRGDKEETISFGDIGESKEGIDWKLLIRREVEKSETIWSQRRLIAENNYAYRLEENDTEENAQTEVMIDVSGSVDIDLVKAFLRQLKPLIKQSKLRVGCFNEKFWGMVDVNTTNDIDNFTIPKAARGDFAWTEDWDLAVRSFTKKREINKIVFTDGYPCPGTMPKEDLKGENVIWLVYGNKFFNPCCGKVINITEKQLQKLQPLDKTSLAERERR
jgi:predicted metal-dependent peptidase